MLVLIILAVSLIVTIGLIFLWRYLYFKIHPERTLDNILDPSFTTPSGGDGLAGKDGLPGIYGKFAEIALDAADGVIGALGLKGANNFNRGPTGIPGLAGSPGPFGSIGLSGEPGLPSNSVVTVFERQRSNLQNNPYRLDHGFTVDGVFYELSAYFLLEELSYFSFQNGTGNKRFKIKDSNLNLESLTSVPSPLDDIINASMGDPAEIYSKKIYTSLRVVLEKKTGDSDGVIANITPPISHISYLFRLNTDDLKNIPAITENSIEKNREFGLDFELVPNNDGVSYLNFLLFGFANYKCIFNIEPPNPDIIPRLEERYSDSPIDFTDSPSFMLEAKGNVRKISNPMVAPFSDIYLLSPRLQSGRVITKNSSNNKNMWTVEEYKRLQAAIENVPLPLITQAFNFLENDNLTIKDDLDRTKRIRIIQNYVNNEDIQDNIFVRLKSDNVNPETYEMAYQAALLDRSNFISDFQDEMADLRALHEAAFTDLSVINAKLDAGSIIAPSPAQITTLQNNYNAAQTAIINYFTTNATLPVGSIIIVVPGSVPAFQTLLDDLQDAIDDILDALNNTTTDISNLQTLIDNVQTSTPDAATAIAALNAVLDPDLTMGNEIAEANILDGEIDAFIISKNQYSSAYPALNGKIAVGENNLYSYQAAVINTYNATGQASSTASYFFSRMKVNEMTLIYPNSGSSLTYPSELEGSNLYLEFIVKVKLDSLENFLYNVYLKESDTRIVVDTNNSIKILAVPATVNIINSPYLDIDAKQQKFVYYRIKIIDSSFEFKKAYGRRLILDFSKTKLFFQVFYATSDRADQQIPGEDTNYYQNSNLGHIYNPNIPAATTPIYEPEPDPIDYIFTGNAPSVSAIRDRLRPQSIDDAFEGDNVEYDFQPGTDDVEGWDFTAETTEIEINNETALLGYQFENDVPVFQRVRTNRLSRGNYFIDVPLTGFNFTNP